MSSTSTSVTLTRTFAELVELADKYESAEDGARIRLVRADGTWLEGSLYGVRPAALVVLDDATRGLVEVHASELRTLEVEEPRRMREWFLAVLGIIATTAVLVAWSKVPGVRPTQEGIGVGFIILMIAVEGLRRVLPAQPWLHRWVTRWRPLYPPR